MVGYFKFVGCYDKDCILYELSLSCICCHELKWKVMVQPADPQSGDLSEKVDRDYVMDTHQRLFRKLGKFWICKACLSSPSPRLSAKNRLVCPSEDVPQRMLPSNEVRRRYHYRIRCECHLSRLKTRWWRTRSCLLKFKS